MFGGITLPGKPDLENIRKLDMLPMPMLRAMSRYGIAIDIPYAKDLTSQLSGEMDRLKLDIAGCIPVGDLDKFIGESEDIEEFNVESASQLAELLFGILNVGRGKQLKLTKSGTRISTGKKQLEVLRKDHPVVDLILQYRERSKLINTYTRKLPEIAVFHPRSSCCPICELPHEAGTWRIHAEFPSTRTDTGRLASRNPNLQNIPARTKLGRLVRALFVASPGRVLVTRDYAQIELRLLAHCSGDENMIGIFEGGGDIHLSTTCQAFDEDYDYWAAISKRKDQGTLSEEEKKAWGEFALTKRAPCKNVNFGIVYGLSASGLFDQMALTYATAGQPLPSDIDEAWCERFIDKWFGLYPRIKPWLEAQHYRARRYGCVWDQLGRIRWIPEAWSVHKWIQGAGDRQAGNMPIQALAAGVFKLGCGRIGVVIKNMMRNGSCWPLLPVHDELIFECKPEDADSLQEIMGSQMSRSMSDFPLSESLCAVPIESDGKITERWKKE